MTDALMIRTPTGLVPDDVESAEVINKIKTGTVIRVKFAKVRNIKFHRKFFALVNFAFDYWEPTALEDPKWAGVVPGKNKDRFRKDLIILAGWYDATYRLNGEVRVEAKSISFDRMNEDEFEKLYSAVIDVVLKHVLTNYSKSELESVIEALIIGFAG